MQGRPRARLSLAASWVRTPREAALSRRIPVSGGEITYIWCFGGLAQARGGAVTARVVAELFGGRLRRWSRIQDQEASGTSREIVDGVRTS